MNKQELFKNIKKSDYLINDLFRFQFVVDYFLEKLTHLAHNKDVSLLKKLDIHSCLRCNISWDETTKPHNAHNMSKEIMLGPFLYERNKVIVLNSTRPFTLKNKKIKKLIEINNDIDNLLEDIDSASTFGGICYNCDQVYNNAFEYSKNLDFSNEEHVRLLAERASFFKFFRESALTEIIKVLIRIKKSGNITQKEYDCYLNICKKIKESNVIENRKLFYDKKMILRKEDLFFTVVNENKAKNKGIMLSDVVYEMDINELVFVNIFSYEGKEYSVTACKKELSFNFVKKLESKLFKKIDIRKDRVNIDLRDIILDPKYIFKKKNISMDDFKFYIIDDIFLYLVFKYDVYFVKIEDILKFCGKREDQFIKNINFKPIVEGSTIGLKLKNNYELIEVDIKILLNSINWYSFNTQDLLGEAKKHKRIKEIPMGVNCLYNIKI